MNIYNCQRHLMKFHVLIPLVSKTGERLEFLIVLLIVKLIEATFYEDGYLPNISLVK